MLSYKQYIHEKRSHPDLNPHIPIHDRLLKYANDENVYVSFTTVQKLGVNPHPISDETVPGIYAWHLASRREDLKSKAPLNEIFNGWGREKYRYVWILKPACKTFIKRIEHDYTIKMLKHDMKYLTDKYPPRTPSEVTVMEVVEKTSARKKTIDDAYPWAWLMRYITDRFSLFKQNAVLRELGYCGFGDYGSRQTFIYSRSEPRQAVFLTVKSAKVLEMFYNDRHEGSERKHYYWRNIDANFLIYNIAKIDSKGNITWYIGPTEKAHFRETEITKLDTITKKEALRLVKLIKQTKLDYLSGQYPLMVKLINKFDLQPEEYVV